MSDLNAVDELLNFVTEQAELWLSDWRQCDWSDGPDDLIAKLEGLRETLALAAADLATLDSQGEWERAEADRAAEEKADARLEEM
jgi:hypothetical protein